MPRSPLLIALCLTTAVIAVLLWSRTSTAPEPYNRTVNEASPVPQKSPATPRGLPSDSAPLVPEAAFSAVDQAKIDAYLALEATRQRLQEYFDAPEENAEIADDIWREIGQLENDGRIAGFEAMHLKLSWLALNSEDEAAYQRAAEQLKKDYMERDRAARAAYRPDDIPGYTDYKRREAEIIAEVQAMQEFPQGQTRQQYLRERLLQARIEAYGETGEQAPPE